MKLRFVTGNPGKAHEAALALAPHGLEVVHERASVREIQADTLEEVARAKAEALVDRVAAPFFVEDAGLFVDGLGGFPGVYSAYIYRTLDCDGILRLLGARPDRDARFVAVIGYVGTGDEERGTGKASEHRPPDLPHTPSPMPRTRLFRGECRGTITEKPRGTHGFGFDPIFVPDGLDRTFAELTDKEKVDVSHRALALRAFAEQAGIRRE
ncbi:MAG: non-canonical purine NTP pyrophosphatase [Methanobacteriota archaeon]